MSYLPAGRYKNYLLLIPLFAAALFYQVANTVVYLSLGVKGRQTPNSPFSISAGLIVQVQEQAARAGLQPGDRVLSVNGQPLYGDRDLYSAIFKHQPGEHITVTAIHAGNSEAHTFHVPLPAVRDTTYSIEDWIYAVLVCAVKLFCVLLGIYVAALLPNDTRAVVFFGLMVSTSMLWTHAAWFEFPRALWSFADFSYLTVLSWGLWLVLFALYFPERFAWDLRRPWIKWTFLGPLAIYTALAILNATSTYYSERALSLLQPVSDEILPVLAICVVFSFTALGAKLHTAKTRDAQRRLRIVYFGSIIGLAPFGCVLLYEFLAPRTGWRHIPEEVYFAIFLLFCTFPATLAYVIVVERAMDVRMVIRQGVRYALARGGLSLMLSAITAGIFFALSVVIFGTRMNRATQIAVLIACTLALRLLIQKTRKRILAWIDRRFFREAYNAQLILEDLSENVRAIVDEKQLFQTVARRISESLHVPQFAVLLHGEGKFQPVYCLGLEIQSGLALPEDSTTVDIVKRSAEPPQIYFDQEDNWVYATPQTELVTLKALHAQLLLPIGQKDKLLGLLSLGPKRSEEPYSPSDIQLLRSVAAQTGLALENSRLTKTIAEEAAHRERLNREIEIAREVQQRLFPQRLPVIAGVDYSGACRPALGVAGDYYDFLALPNGNLGIAIGDVSGKGIAAALLMASLQASLRGQVLAGHTDLAQLITNVNQLIYETTTPERYVTFFYGQYHRESRTFQYVNAGHNPPLVLRQSQDGKIHVIRLETGGPVIGAFRDVPYQQGSLTLEPGDIFVGFTDGVSEAMNLQDEEWGEERLIPAVAQHAQQPAAAIIPSLLSEADRFASGAPQHDDMTLVVMKVCETA